MRRRSWARAFRWPIGPVRVLAAAMIAVALSLMVNWIYQVARKPSELAFPFSAALSKTPAETWHRYAAVFRRYSTDTMSPELLAALAQAEGAGNPLARTYWRWTWGARPLETYRPASSSVGMYQMTDGTFAAAKDLCIREHRVVRAGAGSERRSCAPDHWHLRVLPEHATELTSAYLDEQVNETLARHRIGGAHLLQRQHLATVIHLCGAGAGDRYASRGFRFSDDERCGDHDPRAYLARVDALRLEFATLAARG